MLWFLSLHADTTVSYPVWSTFWFRDESHWGTLKFTAPTLCPVDPELIMTVGTTHPPNTTPTPPLRWHRHNELDPGWVWIIGMQGVVGGVASVMMRLQLSYLSFSWESILHAILCYNEMELRQKNPGTLSTFKKAWIIFPALPCHYPRYKHYVFVAVFEITKAATIVCSSVEIFGLCWHGNLNLEMLYV